uniref:Uncharacterized protein n=1 Tax=Oryza rufipogon TaxID=4529 RepID=A0A0E0PWC8_ORYRU
MVPVCRSEARRLCLSWAWGRWRWRWRGRRLHAEQGKQCRWEWDHQGSNVPQSATRTPATGDDPRWCERARAKKQRERGERNQARVGGEKKGRAGAGRRATDEG